MHTSEEGLNLIKSFESCRLTSYQDSGGVWTIGWGHTAGVRAGQTITQAQADEYLKADLKNAEKYVSAYLPFYDFSASQFSALVSFTYNCGAGNLKKLLNGGQHTIHEISDGIPNFNKAKGKVLRGLVRRRTAEKELFDRDLKRKTVTEIAREVLAGKWGNGADRHTNLRKAGYDYDAVQKEVNRIVKHES